MTPRPIREFTVDSLHVEVHPDRAALGRAAAERAAGSIAPRAEARVVFAAAPSQDEFLDALRVPGLVDWSGVVAFQMDEYLGIDAGHPASFRRYLIDHLFGPVGLGGDRLRLIPGDASGSPLATCLDYEALLRAGPIDLVCGGVGENGHLAFNDPPVADFLDPVQVKTVRLDAGCRAQQVNDGCFAGLDDVPTHAFTLTIPALLSAATIVACVPGPRKAEAVSRMLKGPIGEACPASALRDHPSAYLYLDRESAARLG